MARKKPSGLCCICETYGPLTDEHVPPAKAFNNHRVFMTEMIGKKTRLYQNGVKHPVLCGPCNNNTGSWYGDDYVRFAKTCADYTSSAFANRTIAVTLSGTKPLRIFKQALTMLSAACGVARGNPEVRRLICDRYSSGRPGHLRVFCYLLSNWGGRSTGVAGIGGIDGITKPRIVAEFAWWPVGWLVAYDDQPLTQLADVTAWSGYRYEESTSLTFLLPCLPVSTGLPLDYRKPDEVERDRIRNLAEAGRYNVG